MIKKTIVDLLSPFGSGEGVTFIATYHDLEGDTYQQIYKAGYIMTRTEFHRVVMNTPGMLAKWATLIRANDGAVMINYTRDHGFDYVHQYEDDLIIGEIEKTVNRIEQQIYDQTECDYLNVTLTSNGNAIIIEFLGLQIWNSEDDNREYIVDENLEETENREPLENYLRREIMNELNKLKTIKLIDHPEQRLDNGVEEELTIICDALNHDEGYFLSWKANIAMAIFDQIDRDCYPATINADDIHRSCNIGAENFLRTLMKTTLEGDNEEEEKED